MEHLRRHRLTLILALLPIVPLFLVLFGGHTIGPWDDVRAVTLGDGQVKHGWDILMVDSCLQFTPWRKLVLESWAQGQIPFLNPYALWGQPLLANGQSGALYPLHMLFGILQVPLAIALTLLAWFHLAWAGFGARFWARTLGANEEGGLIAGALVSLSAFFLLWTPLPSVITTCAWIPWVIGLVTMIARGDGSRRTIGALAACLAMMILGGHLQFVAFGFMAVAVTAIYWLALYQRWSKALPLLGAIALGVMVAMPHLGPVLQLSSESHRRGSATSDGMAGYQASAIQPDEYLAVVDSRFLGNPRTPVEVQGIPVPMPGSWLQYAKAGGHPAESAVAIGPLALALLVGWRRGRTGVSGTGGALACVGGLGLLIALGTPFNALLYFGVPGWSSTGSPGRAAVLFVLAAAVAGGVAWRTSDTNSDHAEPTKRAKVSAIVAFGSFVVAFAYLFVGPAPASWLPQGPPVSALRFFAANDYLIVGAISAGAAALTFLFARSMTTRRYVLPSAILSIAIPSLGLIVTSPIGIPDRSPWPELSDPNTRTAFVTPSWPLPGPPMRALGVPNIPTLFRIPSASVYDSVLTSGDVQRFSQFTAQDAPFPPTNGNMLLVKQVTSAPAGVTHVVDSQDPNGLAVEIPTLPEWTTITAMDTRGITLEVQAGERVFANFFYRPGMTATLNGKPVPLEPGDWIQSAQPPSESGTLRVNYTPPGFTTFLVMGLTGLLIMGFLCFLPFGQDSGSEKTDSERLE
ncbi:MAG: hypothetical protein KF812_07900 [Fimbriimonadaceae bacterium]|nr:hypothetical protein [Fimbriimonadaceae bacterium]